MQARTIVITGGTRGIGRGMVGAFLDLGWNVAFTGRTRAGVDAALSSLAGRPAEGFVCEVTDPEQVAAAWEGAAARFGRVDAWINNAGASIPGDPFWKLGKADIEAVLGANLAGPMVCAATVIPRMEAGGGGSFYVMEGLGSDGRMVRGMALYGASKYGLAYFARALASETAGTRVAVGALSPGMVVTDLLLAGHGGLADEKALPPATKRLYNILADRVETVAPWLAERVDADCRSGRPGGTYRRFAWLTGGKAALRFLGAAFIRRSVIA